MCMFSFQAAADGVTDYSYNFLYEDNELVCIFAPFGRVTPMNTSNGNRWRYHYSIADHLGNARVEFVAHDGTQPEVVQSSSYYPFGMTLRRNDYGSRNVNRRLYGGKELQDQTLAGIALNWYDFEARMYDPTIGRFLQTDPKAERYFNVSPYTYCLNNPIMFIDPDGMETEALRNKAPLDDWFENEKTGEIYYNSDMHKGDEGTGEMEGTGWKWLGGNDMFADGFINNDIHLVAKYGGSIKRNFQGNINASLLLKGEKAENFMSSRGYKLVIMQGIEYNSTFDIAAEGAPGHTLHFTYGTSLLFSEKVGYIPNSQSLLGCTVESTLYGKYNSFLNTTPYVSRKIFSYGELSFLRRIGNALKIGSGIHDYTNYYNCGNIINASKLQGQSGELIRRFIERK